MVLLRKTLKNSKWWGLVLILFIPSILFAAKKPQAESLSVEQEAQFKYYWYAAKQAIQEERYADAYALLEFCEMIKPNDGQTLTFLGILYNGIGRKESAKDLFRMAFEADPGDQWYHYTNVLLEQRTMEGFYEAQGVMEKALKANPKNEELIEQLERMYMSDGQWKKALEMQNRLDAIRGFNAYSAMNKYRIYYSWGKPKKAIEVIDQYLELDPTNVEFLIFRVEVLEQMNAKPAVLYAAYEKVLSLSTNPRILNNYAYHLATHKGDLQKAEQMSAITIREEPNNPVFLDTYGWILHLKGEDELALFYLNRALLHATDNTRSEIEKHIRSLRDVK
jgi:tetratricopeptide (TPR) repeat protein